MMDMQEVRCHECGEDLGAQPANIEINREYWVHNRCPVRLARNLGVSAELYEQLLGVAAVTIAGAYPDFPNNVIGDVALNDVRFMRANIAAGAVLEALGTVLHVHVTQEVT